MSELVSGRQKRANFGSPVLVAGYFRILPDIWRARIAACAASGHTAKDWCLSEGFPEHQYYYWKRRLIERPSTKICDGDAALPDGTGNAPSEILVEPGHQGELDDFGSQKPRTDPFANEGASYKSRHSSRG